MLFYNFESLDDFMENNLIANIQSEVERMKIIINLYKTKQTNLNNLTNLLINNSDTINKNNVENFYTINNALKDSFEKLDNISSLAIFLETSLTNVISLYDKDITNNYNEIKAELIEYNKKSDHLYNLIFEFENLITSILSDVVQILPYKFKSKKIKYKKNNFSNNIQINTNNNIETDHSDNNILLISETSQNVYLPYKYDSIKNIFIESKNQYKTMQDVVNDLYVLPLSRFKNSSISRFREAFYLMRHKEKQSIAKSLELGLELMFKYELNPIIITACSNLDELDIYLDCLDKNELFDFKCFEIKFEVSPKVSKKNF